MRLTKNLARPSRFSSFGSRQFGGFGGGGGGDKPPRKPFINKPGCCSNDPGLRSTLEKVKLLDKVPPERVRSPIRELSPRKTINEGVVAPVADIAMETMAGTEISAIVMHPGQSVLHRNIPLNLLNQFRQGGGEVVTRIFDNSRMPNNRMAGPDAYRAPTRPTAYFGRAPAVAREMAHHTNSGGRVHEGIQCQVNLERPLLLINLNDLAFREYFNDIIRFAAEQVGVHVGDLHDANDLTAGAVFRTVMERLLPESEGVDGIYVESARALGAANADRNNVLVWGQANAPIGVSIDATRIVAHGDPAENAILNNQIGGMPAPRLQDLGETVPMGDGVNTIINFDDPLLQGEGSSVLEGKD